MTPMSQAIPHICGLSSEKRRRRRLIMAKVFIDDSGSSAEEPVMWVAAWVGQVPTWDVFDEDWQEGLYASNPKPISYFKHYESRSLSGCFTDFSRAEADAKVLSMAEAISKHKVYGVIYCVG